MKEFRWVMAGFAAIAALGLAAVALRADDAERDSARARQDRGANQNRKDDDSRAGRHDRAASHGSDANRDDDERRPALGLRLIEDEGRGLVVAQVYPDSPAARAGLLVGDEILRFDGEEIGTFDELLEELQHRAPGETVTLTARRGDKTWRQSLKLASSQDAFKRETLQERANEFAERGVQKVEDAANSVADRTEQIGQGIRRLGQTVRNLKQNRETARRPLGPGGFTRPPVIEIEIMDEDDNAQASNDRRDRRADDGNRQAGYQPQNRYSYRASDNHRDGREAARDRGERMDSDRDESFSDRASSSRANVREHNARSYNDRSDGGSDDRRSARQDRRETRRHHSEDAAMGITLSREARGGATVSGVYVDSPADEAGLRAGDVITRANNRRIESPEDLVHFIGQRDPGDKIELQTQRRGKQRVLEVILSHRDDVVSEELEHDDRGEQARFAPRDRQNGAAAQNGASGDREPYQEFRPQTRAQGRRNLEAAEEDVREDARIRRSEGYGGRDDR